MCQDDPIASKINFPADIFGSIKDNEVFFVKRYSKTLISDTLGNVTTADRPHPDIIYIGTLKENGQFFGAWSIEKTLLKINNKITEVPAFNGVWWMERF